MNGIRKNIIIAIGPLLAGLTWLFTEIVPAEPKVSLMAGIALWMAWWWLTECLPFWITALLPLLLLPVFGIKDVGGTSMEYIDRIVFVFAGGFVIALSLEKWGLHKRIALRILSGVGSSPGKVLLGSMITSYLLSMWISNTATVMILLPSILAITDRAGELVADEEHKRKFRVAILLGLAFSATIGGMATLVGTPTNMIFYGKYIETFKSTADLNFATWFLFAFPLSLALLAVCFFVLRNMFLYRTHSLRIDRSLFRQKLNELGNWTRMEKTTGIVFGATALLWFTRGDIDFGAFAFNGWGGLLPAEFMGYNLKKLNHDFLPAVVMALSLFFIPAEKGNGMTMELPDLKKLPFDIIILFGGGFALAMGIEASGLSKWLASGLNAFVGQEPILFVFGMCLMICFISEFASNVACIQLMLPVLLSFYPLLNVHPLYLLAPATLAASLGFMLPIATAPNTIVFGTKRIKTKEMLKAGFFLDVAGVLLITLFVWLAGKIF